MSVKLFVGNLTEETTGTEIRNLFNAIGVVESCRLIADQETGRSKRFGFVEMHSREAANAAKAKFNGYTLHGKTLIVNEVKAGNREVLITSHPGIFGVDDDPGSQHDKPQSLAAT